MDLNLWKDKNELKKFLDNLGIEYRYGCYEEKNKETCHLLADYLYSVDKDFTKAAQVYKFNCEEYKYGHSCDAYGRMLYRGRGVSEPNAMLALSYFAKGCDFNDPQSCYRGGQMMLVEDQKIRSKIPLDVEKSLKMLSKACLSGRAPAACTLLMSHYIRGYHGHPKNMELAFKYALIACHQDEHVSCHNLSRMYHLGDGVTADQDLSQYYCRRARSIYSDQRTVPKIDATAKPDM